MFQIDPFYLRLALWTGLAAMVLAAVLVLAMAVIRRRARHATRATQQLLAAWNTAFEACRTRVPAPPSVSASQRLLFLRAWNAAFAQAEDEGHRQRLRDLAATCQIEATARLLLDREATFDRLVGLQSLGFLRATEAAERIETLARTDHPTLSFAAVLALQRIDPKRAAPFIEPTFASLPPDRLATMLLDELPFSTVGQLLERAPAAFPGVAAQIERCLPLTHHAENGKRRAQHRYPAAQPAPALPRPEEEDGEPLSDPASPVRSTAAAPDDSRTETSRIRPPESSK